MASRAGDWMRQAERDLEHARGSVEMGDHEWACFAAQQSAEKAIKAVLQHRGAEARGHAIRSLLRGLSEAIAEELTEYEANARELDRHYIPTRNPNSVPEGAPFEAYGARESEDAIAAADRIVRLCHHHLAGS